MALHPTPPADQQPYGFEALKSTGLLWLINRHLHPRGFAVSLEYPAGARLEAIEDGTVKPVGWRLVSAGEDELHFELPDGAERESFLQVEHLFEHARRAAMMAEAVSSRPPGSDPADFVIPEGSSETAAGLKVEEAAEP